MWNGVDHLGDALAEAFDRFSQRPALWSDGRFFTYGELEALARGISVRAAACPSAKKRLAVFADRNEIAYCGIIASQLAGMAYVPLNARFSAARNLDILLQADAGAVVCDRRCREILNTLSSSLPPDLLILEPQPQNTEWLATPPAPSARKPIGRREDVAYILFTSGTTGRPKGVPVSHRNVMAYLSNIQSMCSFGSDDRCLQLADLTFDASVHELFTCWLAGGTLFSVPKGATILADRYIREFDATTLLCMPSAGAIMKSEGRIPERSLPSLRHVFFGGEALPVSVAAAWQNAAPDSQVHNLYGPTETTVAVTEFTWRRDDQAQLSATVPIGRALSGQALAVLDDAQREVSPGDVGELWISGSQVSRGYWNNPEMTRERYAQFPDRDGWWYRTGDLVKEDSRFGLVYHGRTDQQLKVRGYRVEAQEVEGHLRTVTGSDQVAVIGWPKDEYGLATGLVAFVVSPRPTEKQIIADCKRRMADYMVPSRIISIPALPINANGKVDYAELARSKAL